MARETEENDASLQPAKRRRWSFLLIAVVIVVIGFLARDEFQSQKGPSANIDFAHLDGIGPLTNSTLSLFTFSDGEAATTSSAVKDSSSTPTNTMSAPEGRSATSRESAPPTNLGLSSVPQLRLAIAGFPRIFGSYYKTKLAQADIDSFKGDATDKKNKMSEVHSRLVADLQQVVLKYSIDHDLDLVLDSGANSSSANGPAILFVRPGLDDITDNLIAVANAGHNEQ